LGFLGYKDQSALSFLKGRSSRILQFFTVCSTMSRQEFFVMDFVYNTTIFFCVGNKRALDFLIFGYFLRILSFSGGVLLTLVLR
jgi:hypothetical protein